MNQDKITEERVREFDGHSVYVGQRWHLRLPRAIALNTMWICDVTDCTVALHSCCPRHEGSRYKIDEIEFVEVC